MNDHEAHRIAAAMHELRPDWPAASLLTLIRKKLIDKPRRDVAVALAWVACEAGSATPARVLEAGPWWRAAGIEGGAPTRQPYAADKFCHVCGQPVEGHRLVDHEPQSAAEYAHQLAEKPLDVHRAVEALKELAHTDPEPRPERPKSTVGTEWVAPIRAAMHSEEPADV